MSEYTKPNKRIRVREKLWAILKPWWTALRRIMKVRDACSALMFSYVNACPDEDRRSFHKTDKFGNLTGSRKRQPMNQIISDMPAAGLSYGRTLWRRFRAIIFQEVKPIEIGRLQALQLLRRSVRAKTFPFPEKTQLVKKVAIIGQDLGDFLACELEKGG